MALARMSLLLGVLVLTACSAPGRPDGGGQASVSPSGVAVTGRVFAAPGCPGPQRAGSGCPPRPVAGALVELAAAGTVVASTSTDDAGRFRFVVSPGRYRVTAHNVGYESQVGQDITVAGALELTLTVDSGIR